MEKRSRDSSLGPLEQWNFFQKLANRIIVTRSKNHMHVKCRYFSWKNLATDRGGWNHPPTHPKMPLTVKQLKIPIKTISLLGIFKISFYSAFRLINSGACTYIQNSTFLEWSGSYINDRMHQPICVHASIYKAHYIKLSLWDLKCRNWEIVNSKPKHQNFKPHPHIIFKIFPYPPCLNPHL